VDQEGLFNHVNDLIRKLASQGPPAQTWEFICECPDLRCHSFVSLTLSEFDDRRSTALPVLAPDHPH
jgi:hypothetical protein